MVEVSITFKKIVAILPLFLFDIILPTMDIGTDAVLISKLYNTRHTNYYVCKDNAYEKCIEKKNCQDLDNPACHLENGTYSCNHTGAYKICLEDPKQFCTTRPPRDNRRYHDLSGYKDGVFCSCGFHPIYASSLLFVFLLNYIVSWITWARLTEVSMRWNTFIFPLLNCFPQFGEFYNFKQDMNIPEQDLSAA